MLEQLKAQGYNGMRAIISADDFGSPVPRQRLYFLAWLSPLASAPFFNVALQVLDRVRQEPQVQLAEFVLDDGLYHEINPLSGEVCAKQRRVSEDCKFKDEHCEVFTSLGMSWPPPWDQMDKVFVEACHDGSLTERQTELVALCEMLFPAQIEEPLQFFDCNMSVKFLIGNKGNPWKSTTGCLTGSGQYWARRLKDDGTWQYRLLLGVEVMQLIGWDVSMYTSRPAATKDANNLLRSFAGNAFSGFAAAAASLALIAAEAAPKPQQLDSPFEKESYLDSQSS